MRDKPQERMLRSGTQRGWQECLSWETAALVPVHLVQPNRAQAIGTMQPSLYFRVAVRLRPSAGGRKLIPSETPVSLPKQCCWNCAAARFPLCWRPNEETDWMLLATMHALACTRTGEINS